MNREQKRAFIKRERRRGVDKEKAARIAEILTNGFSGSSEPKDIPEDSKVMLNVDSIKARKNYEYMSDKYKAFVESSDGKIFTAHVERKNLISVKEEPQWLFWSGDLIEVIDITEDNKQKINITNEE